MLASRRAVAPGCRHGVFLLGYGVLVATQYLYEAVLFAWSTEAAIPYLQHDVVVPDSTAWRVWNFFTKYIGGGTTQLLVIIYIYIRQIGMERGDTNKNTKRNTNFSNDSGESPQVLLIGFTLELFLVTFLKNWHHSPRPFWVNNQEQHTTTIHPNKCYTQFGNPSGHCLFAAYFATYLFVVYILRYDSNYKDDRDGSIPTRNNNASTNTSIVDNNQDDNNNTNTIKFIELCNNPKGEENSSTSATRRTRMDDSMDDDLFVDDDPIMGRYHHQNYQQQPQEETGIIFTNSCKGNYSNTKQTNSRSFVWCSFLILVVGFLAVGFSRMIVGVHSLNQVLYGYALGLWTVVYVLCYWRPVVQQHMTMLEHKLCTPQQAHQLVTGVGCCSCAALLLLIVVYQYVVMRYTMPEEYQTNIQNCNPDFTANNNTMDSLSQENFFVSGIVFLPFGIYSGTAFRYYGCFCCTNWKNDDLVRDAEELSNNAAYTDIITVYNNEDDKIISLSPSSLPLSQSHCRQTNENNRPAMIMRLAAILKRLLFTCLVLLPCLILMFIIKNGYVVKLNQHPIIAMLIGCAIPSYGIGFGLFCNLYSSYCVDDKYKPIMNRRINNTSDII